MTTNGDSPPTAEETERANRQPGPKGGPQEPAPSRHSSDEQPEKSNRPEPGSDRNSALTGIQP